MDETRDSATWRDWCQLVRLPNVFTVIADSTAAFLLVAHQIEPTILYATALLSICCLYWSGMILNDVWDIAVDRQERPSRPLPSNRISVARASTIAWGMMLMGVVLALLGGWLGSQTVIPGGIAVVLAGMIILYDGPLKRTSLAPLAMGSCRFFSFLLAASLAGDLQTTFPFLEHHVVATAIGFGLYIVGVTAMARGEAVGGNRWRLGIGLLISVCGIALIAFAPRFASLDTPFQFDPTARFPILVGLIACTIIYRSSLAIVSPEPRRIQAAIKHAILSLIPLSAAVGCLGAGPIAAFALFALVLPALFLGSFLRVT